MIFRASSFSWINITIVVFLLFFRESVRSALPAPVPPAPAFAPAPPIGFQEITTGSFPGISQVNLYYSVPREEPSAAIILLSTSVYWPRPKTIPGWLGSIIQQDWIPTATDHHLLVVYADICASANLANMVKKGDYNVRDGLGKTLLDNVAKIVGKRVPLCLYSYGKDGTTLNLEAMLAEASLTRPLTAPRKQKQILTRP